MKCGGAEIVNTSHAEFLWFSALYSIDRGVSMFGAVSTLMIAALLLAAPKAAVLREKGTQAYREGRYLEACDLFEQAARLSPGDGAIQADLGLCMAKVGRTNDAYVAELKAIRLGDARTRKNAYFNLGTLNVVHPALSSSTTCAQLSSNVPGCTKTIFACKYDWEYEYERPHIWRGGGALRVWMGKEKGPPGSHDFNIQRENPALGYVELKAQEDIPLPAQPRFQFFPSERVVPGTVDILLEHRFRFEGIDDSPEAMGDVNARSAQLPMSVRCEITAIDACRARLGLFCEEGDGGTRGRRWAEEIDLRPARPHARK